MVKHVYYKKQVTACAWHSLSKMADRKARRTIMRKKRVNATRMDSFITDYVKHKNGEIYNEAKQAYLMLRNHYPNKLNLRLTKEYQHWIHNPIFNLTTAPLLSSPATGQATPGFNDTLRLEIPLMKASNIEKEPDETSEKGPDETSEKGPDETSEKGPDGTLENIVEEVIGEDTIDPSIKDMIPEEHILEIIKDLQNDPEINSIFSDIDEQFDFQQLGEDIEIEDYNLLEKDLPNW